MKQRISISLDKIAIDKINKILNTTHGTFRNRSHVLEKSIELLEKEIEKNEK